MDKEERKAYVKKQREKLKNSPEKFLKENVIEPVWTYWKERPFHAIGTFLFWVVLYYLLFGGAQAINNDMIYCDSTIDQFDGKLMYTYNEFVEYYNDKAQSMQRNTNPIGFQNQEELVIDFNNDYSMMCDYNLTKWKQESIGERLGSIGYGLKKILLKQR